MFSKCPSVTYAVYPDFTVPHSEVVAVTQREACSVAVNDLSHLVLFGPVKHNSDNSEKHLQQKNNFTAHLPVFFHCGALKTSPVFWSLKSK